MVTAVDESRAIRRAKSVSVRVEEIRDDLIEAESRHVAGCRTAQAMMLECKSLSEQWRAQVEHLGDAAESGAYVDYRAIGEILKPACQHALETYRRILPRMQEAQAAGCNLEIHGLVAAIGELERIATWLETWPTNDPSRRQAARRAIASNS
jgi:hypothetical protein